MAVEDPDLEDTGSGSRQQLSPMPFVVALAIVVLAGGLAYLFLREDPGELVRPDRVTAIGDDRVRAVMTDRSPCERVLRAQVDLGEDVVFVELVVERTADQCVAEVIDRAVEITLPEPIGDRDVRPGVGRYHLPCRGTRPSITCAEDR